MEEMLKWALEKYEEQVLHRPNNNKYKATLHNVWKQVIEKCGGEVPFVWLCKIPDTGNYSKPKEYYQRQEILDSSCGD